MDTEMKTTNTKRIDKAMFQMKGLVSQKVSFPYTEWSHIYMFEDANPYSAAQANSALSHNAVVSKGDEGHHSALTLL